MCNNGIKLKYISKPVFDVMQPGEFIVSTSTVTKATYDQRYYVLLTLTSIVTLINEVCDLSSSIVTINALSN